MSPWGQSESKSSSPKRIICYHSCSAGSGFSPLCQCSWLSLRPEYLMDLSPPVRGHRPREMCIFSKQDCPMIPSNTNLVTTGLSNFGFHHVEEFSMAIRSSTLLYRMCSERQARMCAGKYIIYVSLDRSTCEAWRWEKPSKVKFRFIPLTPSPPGRPLDI